MSRRASSTKLNRPLAKGNEWGNNATGIGQVEVNLVHQLHARFQYIFQNNIIRKIRYYIVLI